MYLKELSINGFKSFARKGELAFTTPITAIVGPNGSGKSNVAEAFRFVLGEQSVKSMRGKRGEDLIFNGSESVSRSNRASVTIVLDNPERNGARVFPVDFSEITLERVVHRDGVNEYLMNGGKVRLKDIQELLAAANIGPTGHHIISQGEADRILSSNPKERREMIEDALGLKVFQYKKAESERKLKKTSENVAQVESLRREVAPHLKFLEKQIKKIERSRELQETLGGMYREYLKREDTYIAYHYDRSSRTKHEITKKHEEIQAQISHARAQFEKKSEHKGEAELLTLETETAHIRTKRQDIVHKIGQLEGQQLFIGRQIEHEKKRTPVSQSLSIPRESVEEAVAFIDGLENEIGTVGTIEMFRNVVMQIRKRLKELLDLSVTEVEHDRLETLERELKQVDGELEKARARMDAVLEEERNQEKAYAQKKTEIEQAGSHSREAERELFALMNTEREIAQQLERVDRELMLLERDRQSFKEELEEAVSLLGIEMGRYFNLVIKDTEGKPLEEEEIVCESREIQEGRRREVERMKIRLEELGTGSNEDVMKEYKEVKERDEFLVHEIEDLTASITKLEALIQELTQDLNEQFEEGIKKISDEFERFFILMFGGGHAALVKVKPKVPKKKDTDEIFTDADDQEISEEEPEEGIEIDVKLPNKRVRGLDMLSGGERALTSIALIFAMSQVNPPLFVILDETDAALDEANSRRYGDMISALAERSQLILITHNRETMGRAGVLYGVTMAGDGVSKLLSVKFDEAVAVAK